MTWLMTENWERQVCAEIECEGRSLREMLMLKKCSITEWSRASWQQSKMETDGETTVWQHV